MEKITTDYLKDKMSHLVEGLKLLQDEGEFDEPNLDGSKSDYISFEGWEWPQGVGMYGFFRYYEVLNCTEILHVIEKWYDNHLTKGLPTQRNINTTAPMLALVFLYEKTKNERYLPALIDWAETVINHFPRTNEGGLRHDVSDKINEQQLWDDTLFMTVLFLAKLGEVLQKDDYRQESIHQFLLHIKYLVDKKTGLWYHGWTFQGNHNFADALWGRGNAWVTVGILDYIDMMNLQDGLKRFLLETLLHQMETLKNLQTKEGMWRTLLTEETSYEETSATAGFAYGFLKAARKGYGGKEYKEIGIKGLTAVLKQIDRQGQVQNVSYGTRMGATLDFYKNIPLRPMAYGQSMAMLLLSEAMNHF